MGSEKPHTERWAYRLLYTADIFEFATGLYPLLGRKGAHALSQSVAAFYCASQAAVREVVRKNLSLILPNATQEDARKVFLSYARTIADYICVGTMGSEEFVQWPIETLGLEHIDAARNMGPGVILATGHLGFFELGCVILGKRGYRMSIVTQAEPSGALTEWRRAWRQKWSTETIVMGDDPFSSLTVAKNLTEGGIAAMLIDRPFGERGVAVDAPGGKIFFSTAPALLSQITGSAIVPVSIVGKADGGYRLSAHPPIQAKRVARGERDAELRRCTEAVAGAIIGDVRNSPHQWYHFVPLS